VYCKQQHNPEVSQRVEDGMRLAMRKEGVFG